jgi:2-methylisocitrate lyase-like PEP mutase family enzyme
MTDLKNRAHTLRGLHRSGDPLVLVNAWDTASAVAVASLGGRAIGTSSAGMAASLGIADAPDAPLDTVFAAIGRITRAVEVPVTADLFDGYGLAGDELVDHLLAAGAVGCNIEDSDHAHPGRLLEADTVADRLASVRAAASKTGVEIVLNARIDCLLHMTDREAALAEIVERARRYVDAGADCVFPVGVTPPELARTIVDAVRAPVNAGWSPGVELSELVAAGVQRISVGPQAQRFAIAALGDFAGPLLDPSRPQV